MLLLRWRRGSCSWSGSLGQRDQVAQGAGDVLVEGVSVTAPLVDHEAGEGVVVAALHLGFVDPAGQVKACDVLALDDEPVTAEPPAADVAAVLVARLHAAVDSVVDEAGEA